MSKTPSNTDLIKEFLDFTWERGSRSNNTERTYRNALKKIANFLLRRDRNFTSMTKDDILEWRNELERIGYRSNTMALRFNVLKRFCRWMHYIGHLNSNPYPQFISWENDEQKPKLVPKPSDIFKIRMLNRNALLGSAAMLEMILSSGLRDGEVRQVRACDIDFEYRPIDSLTGKQSLYCGGKITLMKSGMVLKSKSKTTYISKIAAELLLRVMEKHGIKLGSRVPLFPMSENGCRTRMYKIGSVVYKGRINKQLIKAKEQDIRSAGFTDIDVDSLDVSEAIKRQIAKRQAKENNLPEKQKKYREGKFPVETKFQWLHPHSLRHSFTCIMYHRNYHGERANMERLRQMLGHASITTTTIYLTELELIQSDAVWKRLMLGKRGDWIAAS